MDRRRLLVCCTLLLSACASPPWSSAAARLEAATPGKVARFGAALSLSGSMAEFGRTQRRAISLAQDEINSSGTLGKTRIDVAYEDDKSDHAQAAAAFQRLIENKHVLAIIGPTRSDIALSVDPIAQQMGVSVIAISNAAGGVTQIGNFIFRDCLSEAHMTPHLVNTVQHRLQLHTAALLHGDTDQNRAGAYGFRSALTNAGIRLLTEQSFSTETADLTEQLAAISALRPDALFVAAPPHLASTVLVQARQSGLRTTPIVGSSAFDSNTVLQAAGPAAEGLIVGSAWTSTRQTPRNQQFAENYRTHFGMEPDAIAAQAYSSVYILAAAVRDAHTANDPRALRDALERVLDVDTPLGAFSFTPDHEPTFKPIVEIVRGGQFELF